jgi:outer membrane protein
MAYRAKALGYTARQADALYYPSVSLNDTYTYYDYRNFHPAFPIDLVDKQNRFTVTLSMNLVDFSAASEQRQAITMQQHAMQLELLFEQKSADADRELSLKAIERAKTLLEAAKKSKEASDKTFRVVKKKYEARIVDYIRYLDALSKATEARAQYNRANSSLNSAYAAYIYNLGEDPKEYVR